MPPIAVIGGSGFYQFEGVKLLKEHRLTTPFGDPSDAIAELEYEGVRFFFLPRHGRGHRYLPSEVPYRANLYALRILGAEEIISISAVGSLREELKPGDPVIPDQFLDRTFLRPRTFFGEGIVGHVSLAEPICPALKSMLGRIALRIHPRTRIGGTYLCIEGPQFSTRAESGFYRTIGADVIGMTNATEARLAREAGACYVSLCFVTDYDCWKIHEEPVTVAQVVATLHANISRGQEILRAFLKEYEHRPSCTCPRTQEDAIITDPSARPQKQMEILRRLWKKNHD